MRVAETGFSLLELLISIVVTGIMMTAVVSAFTTQSKFSIQQDRVTALEENLRTSLHVMSDAVRSAGYGVPKASLGTWIAGGWSSLPIRFGSASLELAACTAQSVTTVNANAAAGDTTITVVFGDGFTVGRTIWINRAEFAKVIAKTSTSITIDANPFTAGNTGLSRAYVTGVPICQLDVTTFVLNTSTKTIAMTRNGTTIGYLAENISDLTITEQVSGRRYQIALTGTVTDPKTGSTVTRTLMTEATLANRT
jgi:prepilin-type N-terminal cleavage/methylation domain-containing protein